MADLSKGQPEKKFRMPLQEIDREVRFDDCLAGQELTSSARVLTFGSL